MRFQDSVQAYLLQLQADGRSIHTIGQYQRHLRSFAEWIGDQRDLHAIETSDVARFMVATETTSGRSTATLNAVRSSLRTFFAHQHAAGVSRTNPARMLRLALRSPPPPRGLSDDEVERLMGVLTLGQGPEARRDHLLVAVMLRAGLRLGSALALERSDIDFERHELVVRVAKRDQQERVIVCRELFDHLVGFVADRGEGPLFTTRDGGRICARQAQRRIEGWLRRAGIAKGSAHSLRHSFALRLYARCGDVLLVKEALRHRSIASTLVYARPRQADLKRILEA